MKTICRKPSVRNCIAKLKKLPMDANALFPLFEVSVRGTRLTPFANFAKGVSLVPLTETSNKGKRAFASIGNFFSFAMQFLPDGFLQMVFIDTNGFDRQHYKFDYVRREFLGEVRCLVFDVTPLEKKNSGRFLGRIWVEDQDYHIVRFNGAYGGNGHSSWYFHFDSWRTNVQPGVWMPTVVYSAEKDLHYAISKKIDFKAQTRLWGYNM